MSKLYIEATQSFETLIDFIRFGLSRLRAATLHYGHGTDNAWDEIMALVLGSLSLPYDLNAALWSARLTREEKIHLASQLALRIESRVPVPYLTHDALFCDLSFYVDDRVLIPRSPIGELIKAQFMPWIEPTDVGRILDLCTGSGCIAIACCEAFPDAIVDAVDLSPDALAVAQMNRDRFELDDRLTLIESDCFESVPIASYDIIVSNPPYVGEHEMQTLPMEYRHEPVMALQADKNGLVIVERILFSASRYLSPQGILVVEVGNSSDALLEAYPQVPFTWIEFEFGGDGVFLLTAEQVDTYFGAIARG